MDVQLLAALVIGIGTIVVLVLRTRLDAFAALLIAALVTGAVAGANPADTIASITAGFGTTLGSIGIVIGLGVAVGKILEVSGAADSLARAFLRAFGKGREPWAMGSTGALVSIPVFCDSGYVIMNPLARSIARVKQGGYVTLALALGCGMTLTHHLVPPTPGPLAVAGLLGANLGGMILVGLLFAVLLLPVVVIYARWIGPKLEEQVTPAVREAVYGSVTVGSRSTPGGSGRASAGAGGTGTGTGTGTGDDHAATRDDDGDDALVGPDGTRHRVGALVGSLPLLVPLVLIVLNTIATAIDRSNQGALADEADYEAATWASALAFIGNPAVALLIGLVLAVYVLLPRWTPRGKVHGWLSEAAASAGLILLITGAGGALGQVLRDTGIGDALATAVADTGIPGILVPFLIATFVRIAQGSGTVAMITAASVTAPVVGGLGVSALAAALACCAGSMVFSYFNDSYFWVVTRFTGLEGTAALRGWSGITTAVWLGSLPLVLVAGTVL
jgi:GntP family gluconate:H+ symporter